MWVELLLLVVVFVVFAIVHLRKQKYTKEGIPIVGNIPWLGCGIPFGKDGPYFIQKMYKKHVDLFQIRAGGKQLTFFMNEAFLKTFYKSPESEMSFFEGINDKNSSFSLELILGKTRRDDYTPEESEENSFLAIKILKNFLSTTAPNFVDQLYPELDFVLDTTFGKQKALLNQGKFIEVDAFTLFTNMVVIASAKLLIGQNVARDEEFIRLIRIYQENALDVIVNPLFLVKKQAQIAAEARIQATKIIKKSTDQGGYNSFASLLSTASYSTGRSFYDEAPLSTFAFIFATFANTNAAATNCFVEILTNERVKQKVLEEIKTVIPAGTEITNESVSKLEYLGACLTEALRLYAPPIHIRKCQIDVKDQNDKVVFPKGGFVCISPFLRSVLFFLHLFVLFFCLPLFSSHRDPAIYSEPEKFIPERHLDKNSRSKFSFLTFGQGMHYCVGKAIADCVIKLSIVKLLTEYEVSVVKDHSSTNLKNPKLKWFTFGVILPAN